MAVTNAINIRFEYDAGRDLYFAYPCGAVTTEADCEILYAAFEQELGPLERRVDVIVVLDMCDVADDVRHIFGAYRAKLHANFTRYSVRVFLDPSHAWLTQLPTHRDCERDIESAIATIEKKRREGSRRAS